MDTQTLTIKCGADSVPVSVQFRDRSRLSITVHPDGSVTALAPMGRTIQDVEKHLARRRSWIVKQRRHFSKYKPLTSEKTWVSGETHLYLGRQYRLRVRETETVSVRLVGAYFEVGVTDRGDVSSVANTMACWYRTHAETIFRDRLARCLDQAASLRSQPFELQVRQMKRRWGSCSARGTITLNTDLVKTPLHCIEYVIMHELCHLRIPDHGPRFYQMLGRLMPDWQSRKKRLDEKAWV